MRHRKKKKFSQYGKAYRVALLKNLGISLIKAGRIQTTVAKAKLVRPFVEHLISVGKSDSLAARRYLIRKTSSPKVAEKIIKDVSPRYKDRHGGYTRVIKIGPRRGDGATLVYVLLL